MEFKSWRLAAGLGLGLCLGTPAVFGQSTLPQTTEEALRAMTDAAGVVFTGTVTAVRKPAQPGGVVEIDFAVAEAVRGVAGTSYTLREWGGLWPANDEPFRPGQCFLMLLHTPNAAGLSSPVGGPDGAIPIRGSGVAAISASAGAAPRVAAHGTAVTESSSASPDPTVDLGWIATRVVVPLTYTTSVTARPVPSAGAHAQAVAVTNADTGAEVAAGLPSAIPADVRTRPYSSVVAMLRTWEASHVSSR